ncbi:hypothetical protein FHX15_005064 [Rhizobium sp. BK650]|uniref:hypothetical protein n=1 Tax=Rhizobium sp. BK650 TaxID=2586990 RepID=UPI0016207791|nr:hypothetical protein [Rhizobium sp. BK650]MBB3659796.1 hypothetical protein [Rhizobium sp. BK650]
MSARQISQRDQALTSEDLDVCQQVVDAAKAEFQLLDDDEETSRAAAVAIELYRQGVRNIDQLKVLVFAARGKI